MAFIQSEIRPGAYYDSAVLMQLQRGLLGLPGVLDSGVVMGTPANLELLGQSGLLMDEIKQAGANDLVIVVKAETEARAAEALSQVEALLVQRRSSIAQEFRPKSLETAVQQLPEAGWVLVSVPGRFAAGVAREALGFNRHVFLYSDNVSLEEEIELKKTAQSKGLLVMGPDCGTAIVNGVGLGFANRVRRGAIGLIGASGTGLQAITSRIHALGGGVSHAIGTGGRDLKAEVGAITAHQALDALARDPETKVIAIVSKPPAASVATKLLAAANATGKPVVVDFIGFPPPARRLGNLHFATSLSEAAELAVKQLSVNSEQSLFTDQLFTGCLRGLFSGGTLAYEAALGLSAVLSPLYSNSPISNAQLLPDPLKSQAHTIVDLGDEVFMVGRLHPMIDNDLRLRRLKQEAADPDVGLILLDVVLGEGAHPDPASELGPVIKEIRELENRRIEVVVMVIGTDADPQNVAAQIERLKSAGAVVFRTATEAIDHAARRMMPHPAALTPPVALDRLTQTPLAAINIGLESFYDSLTAQGAQAVHVDWRPPAGGNEKLAAILAKMKKK